MVAILHFAIYIRFYRTQNNDDTKELEKLKHLSMKTQEATSNVAITEKNEQQYVRLQLTKYTSDRCWAFSDKAVAPDIDGFTDEPVVQC